MAKLKANPHFASEAERVQALIASGAGRRATYFNQAKKLPALAAAPVLKLTQTSPPAEAVPGADCPARLRRRFGRPGNG